MLKSHKIPFKAVDLATDAKAKRFWMWKSKDRKLPAVVKDGVVLGVNSPSPGLKQLLMDLQTGLAGT